MYHNSRYPKSILALIAYLKKLPGVGSRTAERFAFHMLKWEEKNLFGLSESLLSLKKKVVSCPQCGCLTEEGKCFICSDLRREKELLCLVSSPKDVYAIDTTETYKGFFHVIDNLLSPIENKTIDFVQIDKLKKRMESLGTKELIIAFDSTLEGDATALYLQRELQKLPISITRIACGLPMGSPLEYIDGGTLARALAGRRELSSRLQ